MKAVQLLSRGIPGKFRFGDVPNPKPGPDEVVVRVKACGVNHLDLWVEEENGLPMKLDLPRVPGCEVAGEIAELGADVDQWIIGDKVAVQSNLFCGSCEYCLAGQQAICLNAPLLGVECDGGFAELVKVPARCLVRIPDGVSFETSAALTLAGSTAMHMLTDRVSIETDQTVLVIGASSGVGSAAIQIAKELGAKVITTGSTSEKREFGRKLGADHALDPAGDWPREVREITEKRGVEFVVEHVGGEVLEKAFTCLGRGGTIITCGATAGRSVSFEVWPFFVKQHQVIGSYGRNHADLNATLQWAAEGRLKPVIHQVFPLAGTSNAYELLRERKVLGKLLVKP
ncbi:MAG: NADPH:quinone reductase [Verrucomicrobiales bacterium]|nr:NADPH:quinone reductase [Verrucomicrobiales bacterium]|tara:strand:- start:18387 stop:19415 length:1029 start_codon:yes stop_codon:yes gene_type:complete